MAAGDVGATALAIALRGHPTPGLTDLHCYNNRVGDSGASELGLALSCNARLRVLSLGGNSIGDSGAVALATGLADNDTLTELYLFSNRFNMRPGMFDPFFFVCM